MEWDDREMRETSVGKRRKRAFEVRSDQMDIDGEREEEDAGREKKGPLKVPLEAGSQNQAFSGFLSVPFSAKPVQIAPGLRQFFENLSGLWEQAFCRSKTYSDCRI